MKYLLDTNICIYVIKKRPEEVFRKFEDYDIGDVGISSITYAELCYGVEKSLHQQRNKISLETFTAPLEILEFDSRAAAAYGKIRDGLEKKGKIVGAMDLLIGAHALAAGLTLVSNNLKEFKRIPGLLTENWVE